MSCRPSRPPYILIVASLFAAGLTGCREAEPTYEGTTLTRWLELAEVADVDTQLGAIKALSELHFHQGKPNPDITAVLARVSRSNSPAVALAAARALQPADALAATQAAEWICAHDESGQHADEIVEIIRSSPRYARQQLRPVVAQNLTKNDQQADSRRRLELLLSAIDAPD